MFSIERKKSASHQTQTALIRIGKCGGGSLNTALREAGIADELRIFHVQQPVFRKNMNYIILARNPLKQTISAFNWRYKLVVVTEEQRHCDPGEYEVLTQYGSINVLGEALYDDDGTPRTEAIKAMRTIGHIRMDISFYLTKLLDRCRPDQIEAVLMQETLNKDIAKVFGINNVYRIHENSDMRSPPMSSRARKNLMRFLHRDYEALARLYAWGKIDTDTYIKAVS